MCIGNITLKCTIVGTTLKSRIEGGSDFSIIHFRDKKLVSTKVFNNMPALANFFVVGRVYEISNAVVSVFNKKKVIKLYYCWGGNI